MLVRLLALLLTVMMMTGAAAQAVASPDVASFADDSAAPDGADAAVLPAAMAVAVLMRPAVVTGCPPRSTGSGRIHASFVFRPPRLIASH